MRAGTPRIRWLRQNAVIVRRLIVLTNRPKLPVAAVRKRTG
jgi:hypothetical protein